MKCVACGAQWSLPATAKVQPEHCPFCGASLRPAEKARTMTDVLRQLMELFGPEILKNEKALLSGFSDLAPQLTKERLLLEYLVRKDTHLRLLEAAKVPAAQQKVLYGRAVHTLHQEQFIVREAAELVCTGFLAALGVTIAQDAPGSPAEKARADLVSILTAAASRKAPAGTTPPKSAPAPKKGPGAKTSAPGSATYDPQSPVNCYEDYKKALTIFFVQNGRVNPTNAQILSFIWTYKLDQRFGITPADVRADLHAIAPSIC